MDTQTPIQPLPAPPAPEEAQRKHLPRWLVIVAAVVIGAGIVGAVGQDDTAATTSSGATTSSVPCLTTQGSLYAGEAASSMRDAIADVQAFDLDAAAADLRTGADYADRIAAEIQNDPAAAASVSIAADHLRSSAAHAEAFEIEAATADLTSVPAMLPQDLEAC